jgi:glutamine synthetase
MPGQWEFQIGPSLGIKVADHLWVARYLLGRVAEDLNVTVSYSPKLFEEFAGAGGHVNFSTKDMREGKGGLEGIIEIIRKLSIRHTECLEVYGDNSKRLSGKFETSSIDTFTYGAGDRAASVRIPTTTIHHRKGYIEDRRPASDLDPYLACAMILDATLLEESLSAPLLKAFREWREWRSHEKIE